MGLFIRFYLKLCLYQCLWEENNGVWLCPLLFLILLFTVLGCSGFVSMVFIVQ